MHSPIESPSAQAPTNNETHSSGESPSPPNTIRFSWSELFDNVPASEYAQFMEKWDTDENTDLNPEHPQPLEEWDTDEDTAVEIDEQELGRMMTEISAPSSQGLNPSANSVPSSSTDSDSEHSQVTEERDACEDADLETDGVPTVRVKMGICPRMQSPESPSHSFLPDSPSTTVLLPTEFGSEIENISLNKGGRPPSPPRPALSMRDTHQAANEAPQLLQSFSPDSIDDDLPDSINATPVAKEKASLVSHPQILHADGRADEALPQPSNSGITGDATPKPRLYGPRSKLEFYFIIGPDSPESSPESKYSPEESQKTPRLPPDETKCPENSPRLPLNQEIMQMRWTLKNGSTSSANSSQVASVPGGLGISTHIRQGSSGSSQYNQDFPQLPSDESKVSKDRRSLLVISPAASSDYGSRESLASSALGPSIRDTSNPKPFTAEDFAINWREFFKAESSNISEDLSSANSKPLHSGSSADSGEKTNLSNLPQTLPEIRTENSNISEDLSPITDKLLQSDSSTDSGKKMDLSSLPQAHPENNPIPSRPAAEFLPPFSNTDIRKTDSIPKRRNTLASSAAAHFRAAFRRTTISKRRKD